METMTNFISLGSKITADSDCVRVKSFQSCTILCNPMDCSLPDSSVHGTLQARILEWVAFPSPGDLPDPGTETGSPALQVDSLPADLPGKPVVAPQHVVS